MKNATNNGYTRCNQCHTVYEDNLQSCPECGKLNTSKIVSEGNLQIIDESVEPVFNLLD